ncbi:MAG: hypothetical protein IPM29_28635 [Planctomycetes bacterium]|nr:hypothetical protein [Planctomycetota bacterium]
MKAPILPLALGLLAACDAEPSAIRPHSEVPSPSNRIAVPAAVRRNLGIDFVAVERRRVASTMRVPGHFEMLPAARREYRTPIPGRVEIVVEPLQPVAAGDVLYRIDSPQWRAMQRALGELETGRKTTLARFAAMQPLVAAHRVHEQSLEDAVLVMETRVADLERTHADVGGQASELAAGRVQLAQTRAELAEAAEKRAGTEATLAELEAELAAADDRIALELDSAATILSIPRERLVEGAGQPFWRSLGTIEVRAVAAGLADALPVASGGWVGVGDLVLVTSDLQRVQFRAQGLQSDLPRLRPGLPAWVVPPRAEGADIAERVPGELHFGVEADPRQRTIDLFLRAPELPRWARPGVAAFLEVETASGVADELAVPASCVLRDGMARVLFRRDPKDPDTVIRIEADLGHDDGRWVEVRSGLKDGDEVVLAGAYELMLASSGTVAEGGHFHADGTFHQEQDK